MAGAGGGGGVTRVFSRQSESLDHRTRLSRGKGVGWFVTRGMLKTCGHVDHAAQEDEGGGGAITAQKCFTNSCNIIMGLILVADF